MYKTAKALGITAGERKWLIKTAKVLARMAPKEARQIDGVNMSFDLADWFKSDLSNDVREKKGKQKALCGTLGCIKGWMGTLACASDNAIDLGLVGLKGSAALPSKFVGRFYENVPMAVWNHSEPLADLFTPDWIEDYHNVTPKDAARAILGFLKSGVVTFPMKYYRHHRHMEIRRRKDAREDRRNAQRSARNLARRARG